MWHSPPEQAKEPAEAMTVATAHPMSFPTHVPQDFSSLMFST